MSKPVRQVIALGGGGFSEAPNDEQHLLLDRYILSQSLIKKPKICFIPAAGGDHPEYIEKFYNAYSTLDCFPVHLELSQKKYEINELEKFILSQDIIFIGGGNPNYLTEVLKKTKVNRILKSAYKQGIVMSGMSAGAMCWFSHGFYYDNDNLKRIRMLGLLEGMLCPHYGNKMNIVKMFKKLISSGKTGLGYGVADCTALHFINGELVYTVSSHEGHFAYKITNKVSRLNSKKIKPILLG